MSHKGYATHLLVKPDQSKWDVELVRTEKSLDFNESSRSWKNVHMKEKQVRKSHRSRHSDGINQHAINKPTLSPDMRSAETETIAER